MIRKHMVGALALSFALFAAGAAHAAPSGLFDQEGEDKKNEKDLDEAEKNQGQGQAPGQGPGGAPGQGGQFENPLEKILKLMEQVEGRLFDADTGGYTQEEQKKIVEALRFEDKTSAALEELINKVEQQQQQQSQSQSQSQDQKQQQEQRKNETEQQRKEREQKERERQQREKEQERQRQAQQQKQQQKQEKPQDQQAQREKQQQREGQPPPDQQGDATRDGGAAGRWGQLPSKLHQDAANARNHAPPERWSDLIKRYRERLSKVED